MQALTEQLETKEELLEDEKRKIRQLSTEIVDLRVHRIGILNDEINKLKSQLSLKTDELADLEKKLKELKVFWALQGQTRLVGNSTEEHWLRHPAQN